jgi:two-component system, sensor histidine kinase and response regulator
MAAMTQNIDPEGKEERDSLHRRLLQSERLLSMLNQQVVLLEQERKKLAAIVNHSDAGFLIFNPQRLATWCNTAAPRILGFGDRMSEILGHNCHEVLCRQEHSADDCPGCFALFCGAVIHQEMQFAAPSGPRIVYVTAVPLKSAAGTVEETMVMLQDVSDLESLRRSQRQLEEARNRAESATAAKSEFLANMSHEIRTPLHAVIGMADLLHGTELNTEQMEYTRTIRSSGDALLQVINDILDFSKGEAGKLVLDAVAFDLPAVFEDAVDLVAEKAHARSVDVTVLFEQGVPDQVIGDPGRLRQVILNLVGNAIKFTERGDVTVTVRRVSEDDRRTCLRVDVTDTGIGISPEHRALLFQPFVQADGSTSRRFGGTGLGLAISRTLVELMGGHIDVVSEAGRGSTFSCTLAVEKPDPDRTIATPRLDAGGRRALVVGPHAPTSSQLNRLLEAVGHRVDQVPGIAGAVQAVREGRASGDALGLLLVDHRPPVCDGFELVSAIRREEAGAGIPIVLSSSFVRQGDSLKASLAGCGYLPRPVRRSRLYDQIRAATGLGAPTTPLGTAIPSAPAPDGPGLRLLVVDDNPVNQRVISRMLERLGHRVETAANGLEAVEAVSRGGFDAVLMDCQMPVLDGYAASLRIRNLGSPGSRIPILALTASALADERQRCLNAGMNDFLAKPLRLKDLESALSQWVPQRRENRAA